MPWTKVVSRNQSCTGFWVVSAWFKSTCSTKSSEVESNLRPHAYAKVMHEVYTHVLMHTPSYINLFTLKP